jgi:nucleoid-associated protein YgaU
MSLQVKYAEVLALANKLGIKDFKVAEDGGKLSITGTTKTQYEKNIIWDKIKEVGGEAYSDIGADLRPERTDVFHVHTVESGENLSKIAKQYYKDANKYMNIFNANKDILSNPDLIKPGQELKIPNL